MMKGIFLRILALCLVSVLVCGMTACTPQNSGELSSGVSSGKNSSTASTGDIDSPTSSSGSSGATQTSSGTESDTSSITNASSQTASSEESKPQYKEEEWRLHHQDYKLIAFTFDDGPESSSASDKYPSVKLANLFEQYHGGATFFLIGSTLEKNGPAIPKYILSKGSELASHSYNHATSAQMKNMTPAQLRKEILGCSDLLEKMVGVRPKFFRAGNYAKCTGMWELLKEEKVSAIFSYKGFSDYVGGKDTADSIAKYLTETDIPDGAIMGMHSNNMNFATPDGLEKALPILYEKGYRFCTLSELFELRGITYDDVPQFCYISRVGVDAVGQADIRGQIQEN